MDVSISNYGELKTAVADWLNDSTLTARIPDFILYAESIIYGDPKPVDPSVLPGVRVRAMYQRIVTAVTTEYFTSPANLLELRDIQINTDPIVSLKYLTPKQLTDKYLASGGGPPKHYTIIGDEIQLKPDPDASIDVEIGGNYKFTAFSADVDENWLLTNHPFIYLYAALIAASPYLKDTTVDWKSEYITLVKSLNASEKRGQYGSSISSTVRASTP